MISRCSAAVLATVLCGGACATASAWQTTFSAGGSYSSVTAVEVHGDGNVVATGSVRGRSVTTKLDTATGAVLWRRGVPGVGLALAIDSQGNAVSVGYGSLPANAYELMVIKHAGDNGEQIWRRDYNGNPYAAGYAVAASSTDDVFVSGSVSQGDGTYSILIARLAASDGAEVWQQTVVGTVPNAYGSIRSLAVDAADDLVAAGGVTNADWAVDFTVVKLASSTGQQLWRYSFNGTADEDDSAAAVVVDSGGDVIAAGSVRNTATAQDIMIVKLNGVFGFPVWQKELSGDSDPFFLERAFTLAVDTDDDVYAVARVGGTPPTVNVMKLSGTTGNVLWESTLGEYYGSNDSPSVRVAPDGSIVVVAPVAGLAQDIAVAKLDGDSGATLWQRTFNGRAGFEAYEDGGVIAIDADANLFVGASVNDSAKPSYDFAVFKLGAEGGEDLVAGKRLDVRDGDTPDARRLSFQATGIGISPSGDSDPTSVGATLELINPASGENTLIPLSAGNWDALGKPDNVRGFQYRGLAGGPCKRVVIKHGGKIKATCKGSEIGFSLDEASQGTLAVRLTTGFGPGARVYCAEFGGEVSKDEPGRFYAKGAPAPTACADP